MLIPGLLVASLEGVAYLCGVEPLSADPHYLQRARMQRCQYDFNTFGTRCSAEAIATSRPHVVLALGGSSVEGYPPGHTDPFPNQLSAMLHATHPGEYAVFNLGSRCKDSTYVRKCVERAIAANPEVLVIYAGHNSYANWGFTNPERQAFLEDHPWILDLQRWLAHSRAYSLEARLIASAADAGAEQNAGVSDETFERSRRFILERYTSDISSVIDIAARHGTRVILVTVVSNLHEFPVPKSLWNTTERTPSLQPRRREVSSKHFWSGVDLYHAERHQEALAQFKLARDEDPQGRAPSELNERIRELGRDNPQVHVVDFEKQLDREGAADGIGCNFFGDETYCDQFHPNTRTGRMIAESVFQVIDGLRR